MPNELFRRKSPDSTLIIPPFSIKAFASNVVVEFVLLMVPVAELVR